MSADRPVDLPAVRRARANLDRLARDHPELTGPPSAANRAGWEYDLAQMENAVMANRRNPDGPTVSIAVRLPQAVIDDLDSLVKRLEIEAPYRRTSRADALRLALTVGLERLEPPLDEIKDDNIKDDNIPTIYEWPADKPLPARYRDGMADEIAGNDHLPSDYCPDRGERWPLEHLLKDEPPE
jgi:hypothetical protein